MNRTVIKTETEYQKVIARTLSIFHAAEGTPEAYELTILLQLVKDYEANHVHIPETADKNAKPEAFKTFLMQAPVMDAKQYEEHKNLRRRFNAWRQKK